MTTAETEQIKLSASCLNTLAASCISLGVIGPIFGLLIGVIRPDDDDRAILVGGIFLLAGCGLHGVGRYVLRSLKA